MIWLKYFSDVNTMGSQCVHRILQLNLQRIGLKMTVQRSKHVAYIITLCNKNSCADAHY